MKKEDNRASPKEMRGIIIIGPYSDLMSLGLRVLVKKQHFHNTSKTTTKSLFRAPNWRKQCFIAVNFIKTKGHYSLMILLLLGALLPYVHAQSANNAFVIRTVNVFPSKVESEGWSNVETISFQNLDDYALLQEFNSINSATLGRTTIDVPDLEQVSSDGDNKTEPIASPAEPQIQTESLDSVSTTTDSASTTPQTLEVVEGIPLEVLFGVPSSSPEQSLPEPDISISKASTAGQAEPLQETIEADPEPLQENFDPATTTVMRRVTSFFALTVSTVTSLFDSATSTETISEPEETIDNLESQIDNIVPEIVALDKVLVQGSTTTLVIDVVPVHQTEASSTDSSVFDPDQENVIMEVSSSTDQMYQDVITDPVSTTTEVVTQEALTSPDETDIETPVNICVENCMSHTMLLSDFGYQLDTGVEISGAQLRLSFAAKKKDTREHVPQFTVSYSVDNGLSWLQAGSIVIGDEVSNSINGGYFLYSLPEVEDQAKFDSLEVQLSFADDQSVIDELYVESVWLELFTLEPPEFEPVDFNELLLDDGFDQDVMSGDNLELPDGSVLDFNFTDENNNESLIIKSNESTYQGLSEVTTYFSVTNISNKEEDFSIQTYFPAGAGEVTSLQVFDQNKPRKTIIPEYRPYVYHCEAGWEYEGRVIPETLQELSEQLSKKSDSQEVLKEDVEIVTDPIFFDVSRTATTSTIELEEILKNTTTTVLKHLPSITQFLQFSTTTKADPFLGGVQVEDEKDTALTEEGVEPAPAESEALEGVVKTPEVSDNEADSLKEVLEVDTEDDLVLAYSCRNTNVVRECDELDGANTACRLNQVKVQDHEVTKYVPGWDSITTKDGSMERPGLIQRIVEFIGFGPDRKEIPDSFEAREHTSDKSSIQPGETKYFKMDIEFPPFSSGEYWIEAVGKTEYGLLDPFWSSQWQYRLPISIDNTSGASALTEQQVFLEIDSSLTDFWSNVQDDGGDIRFVQETVVGNIENWYGTGWAQRHSIVIQAAQVDSALTDFPVYVDLSDLGSSFFNGVGSSGIDIRVTQGDGMKELPYDLVALNTGGETGELHFKADSISDTVDTTFYVYYDNPNVLGYSSTDTYGSENVWTNNYESRYAMDDSPASSGSQDDSTNNNNGAVAAAGMTAGDLVTGKIGTAIDFDGAGDVMTFDTARAFTGEFTLSGWWNFDATGFAFHGHNGSNEKWGPWSTGGGSVFTQVVTSSDVSVTNPTTADWHYMVLTRDASDIVRMYVDGVSNTLYGGAAQAGTSDWINLGGQPGQQYDGRLDEIRISDVQRSDEWISTEFNNQSTSSTFYSTGSAESLTISSFSELDHWVQYFSTTTSEADVWVQVDSMKASASTTIYLYYGSSGAVSASDEYAPFTYSTSTALYYVTSDLQTNPIVVYSLIDGNEVSIDGNAPVSLDSGETTSFATYSSSSVISALGPITAKTNDVLSEPPVPISFATTTNLVTTNRTSEVFYVHAPFADASVDIFEGASVVATSSGTVVTGSTRSFSVDITGSDSGILESDEPVLLFHSGTNDSYVAYPPTTRPIFGVYSSSFNYTSITDSTEVGVYCSGGASGTTSGMSRGIEESNDFCSSIGGGLGDGVMLANATNPIAATQEDDGDGGESTRFLPEPEFGTRYILPQDAEYVTMVCSPRFGTSTIEVQTSVGVTIDAGTCAPAGSALPGVLNFTPATQYTQGYQVVSTNDVPFYMYYEEDTNGDETNTWSAVQARAFESLDSKPYAYGVQEINIDAEYEQLSYMWYQNIDDITPTTTWSIGDDGNVSEGEDITGQGAVHGAEILRLRMNLQANVATGTASSTAFALQYSAAETCSTASSWYEIGKVGSTTAAFSGYNNDSVDDGVLVSSTTLTSSTVFATYEEASLSAFIQNDINPGEVAEWDWVITSSNAVVNTNYCFRMVRSSGDELTTYTNYPQLLTSGPPEAATLFERFDNEHATSTRPTLEFVASDFSGDDLDYYVQVDDTFDFTSTVLNQNSVSNSSQFENIVVSSDNTPFNSGQTIRYTPPSDLVSSTTYWWRVRSIDSAGSNTYSDWSTPYSFTINESLIVSEWHQTTDEQFDTNSLISLTTSGSDSVELDLGGSSEIGEYGSIDVTNGAITTISLYNSYTNPVVTASVEYSKTVPNGDQPSARVFNKTGIDFDVYVENFTGNAPGTSTVHYVVMEAGEYLMDDGDQGLRIFATSTSVSGYMGSPISGDPGLDIVFPASFSTAPAVLTMVTTNNDPDWILSTVYDGNSIKNPPSATQMGVFLQDNLESDGHSSAEDVDIIAFDQGFGTNNGGLFDIFNTGIDGDGAFVDDTADTFTFGQTFSSPPAVSVVQMLTTNGSSGGYAMVDIDTPITTTGVDIAVEEGGTAGARTHSDEDVSVVVFENATGTIIRASIGALTSSIVDFDDADVGNAWGEVSFVDSGDINYRIQYQTGTGFVDIPDTALTGNNAGFTSSPINILDLDTDTYNEIRIVAEFSGAGPELSVLTISWGQRVDIPVLGDPFNNEKVPTTTPTFDFVTTDPQGDDLVYQISWSTDDTFATGSTTRTSSSSANFANLASSTDTSPFISGDTITYAMQSGEALTDTETYWWRVRAKDPGGSDSFSPWSDPDSFAVDTATLVSTWSQTTEEQFEEGVLDGVTASTSDSILIATDIGEYGSTTVTDNSWSTVTTNLTYNNMVVVASPEYAYNGTDNGRTVQVKDKTNNSFMIKADNYTESLSGSTVVDYVVMEAGDWLMVDGGAGMRVVAGTAPDVSAVKGSSPGYVGGTQISFSPAFSATPAGLSTVSSANANGPKWVAAVMDDGTEAGEITTTDMYLALGIGLDNDTTRIAEDIDYLAFSVATGTNNGVLYDAFNTGDVVTESDSESTVNFSQSFSGAPGIVIAQNNATHGADGAFAQQDTDGTTDGTTLSISVAEMGVSAGNHTAEIVSVLAFESDGGIIRRESVSSSGLVGTVAGERILFSDGTGPKFKRALFATTSPGISSTTVQLQYLSGSVWTLIPDIEITGNSTGFTDSPIDLTGVDVSTYSTVRLLATLNCDASNCPTLEDWSVEWSEGMPVSGTLQGYDQSTNITGTQIRIATNGVVQSGKSDVSAAGVWSIANVKVLPGDIVTAFAFNEADESEAVGVTRYDGVGNITGFQLFERHLTLGSDDATSTPLTNADIGLYDVANTEDVFFNVTGDVLTTCGDAGCFDAEIFVNASTTYNPGGNVNAHDIEINGTLISTSTLYVSGSWDNNATTTLTGGTVVMVATSTTESIDTTGAFVSTFGSLEFGTTTGTATWTLSSPLDVDGDLLVTRGTLSRGNTAIMIAGDLTNDTNGFWTGIGSTTFDGAVGAVWRDTNAILQNIGNVAIDGTSKIVTLTGNVAANSITIGADDSLDVSVASYDITTYGDFINNNTFVSRNGAVLFAATTTGQVITAGSDAFYDVQFTGGGGTWSFTETTLTVENDYTIATGTVIMTTATTTIGGSFSSVGGLFAHNNSIIDFDGTGAETITASGTVFTNAFYDITFSGSGSWTVLDTNATTSNDIRITGGTLVTPSGELVIGGSLLNTTGSITASAGTVKMDSGVAESITPNGSSLYSLLVDGAGTFIVTDTNAEVSGDLTVSTGTLVLPSGIFSLGGSLLNNATITPQTGTVLFNSTDTGETVDLGSSSLYNMNFDAVAGGWTITQNATTTNNFTLATSSDFTLASGQVLSVGNVFTNSVGGASTTWSGSTLMLDSASEYEINTKTTPTEQYENLIIGSNTDISSWNSAATSTVVAADGSLYSQDNAGVDGNLFIFGDYRISATTEYWSYATDFDGEVLGSSRKVNVSVSDGSTVSLDGGTLYMTGED